MTGTPTRPRFTGPLTELWGELDDSLVTELRTPPGALNVPPATEHHAWSPAMVDQVTLADFEARGAAALGRPWPQTLARDYARYHRDGDRLTYEAGVSARTERLTIAAVLAAVTRAQPWLDEALDGVVLLCEQSTWCWPAHDDAHARCGAVLPTVTDPYLDLGAGEVAAQLAWIDHLLGDLLEAHAPGLRARIRYETRTRVLDPFRTRRDWHWLGLDGDVHNWNPWIHGNVLLAALQLADGRERAETIALAIQGLDRYLAVLGDDGAIDEGFNYWWNGACRALEALELLSFATDGALDAHQLPCLRQTVAFPHRMHLGGPWYVNHADASARCEDELPWRELHHAAIRAGDDDARRLAASQRHRGLTSPAHGLGRVLRALTDRHWRDAVAEKAPLPGEVWLPSIQVLLARPRAGSAQGLTLAVKGGHNGEHHNHNDVGSVIVAIDGVPALVDAGRPVYTAQTFGPDRYQIRAMQSSWHNVPEVQSMPQRPGAKYRATNVLATLGEQPSLSLDLAACYDCPDLTSWQRSARLDRQAHTITIRDTWQLECDTGAPPTEVHLLCAGAVRVRSGQAIVRPTVDGPGISLAWPPDLPVRAQEWELEDTVLRQQWGARLTRLTIDVSHLAPADVTVLIKEVPAHE